MLNNELLDQHFFCYFKWGFFGSDRNVNKPQKKQSALACAPLEFS